MNTASSTPSSAAGRLEAQPSQGRGFKRVLGLLDMTLFTVCAILVIDTLAASAAIGPSSMTWWLITLVLFFVPYALMTAELGAAYPREGGLQGWIRAAYGDRWAARATWCYWVNVALWMPSVYILFAGMFAQLFWPAMSLVYKIAMAVALSWLTVLFGILSLEVSKWVPNLGAFVKAAIMLLIGGGGIYYAAKHGSANPFTVESLTPQLGAGLAFLPVIVYNYLGFELMSGAAEEMKNPARDVPIAVIVAGIAIALFYLLATFGILAALPLEQIGLVEGLLDTAENIFGNGETGKAMVMLIGIGALYTFFANMVTWSLGANRSAQSAADDGELPRLFGRVHPKHNTPAGAFVLMGLVGTAVVLGYGYLAQSTEELFWTLFAFSSIVFLLPYLGLFPTFVKLRRIDTATTRPYRVPGSRAWLIAMAFVCVLFIVQAIVFFVWVPGEPTDGSKAGPILIGVAVTLAVGELLIAIQRRRNA
jgi:glutamate:GABA antiporter